MVKFCFFKPFPVSVCLYLVLMMQPNKHAG